jgi:hypothetical protein
MQEEEQRKLSFVDSQVQLIKTPHEPPGDSDLQKVDPSIIRAIVDGIQRRKTEYLEAMFKDQEDTSSEMTQRIPPMNRRTSLHRDTFTAEELDAEFLRSRSGSQLMELAKRFAESPLVSQQRRNDINHAVSKYTTAETRNNTYRAELADMERIVSDDPIGAAKNNLPSNQQVTDSVTKISLLSRNLTRRG